MVHGRARRGAGPSFRVTDEPGLGRTLKIVQPLMREKRFAGALVGVIALAEDNLIAPALHDNLPQDTDAVLVDTSGQIIYPPIARAPPRARDGRKRSPPPRAAPAAR